MLRSLYTSGTAMIAQTRRMDVVTNNLANVETRGYKADNLVTRSFRDMLIERLNDPSVYVGSFVGRHNTGIHIDQVFTTFVQGAIEVTNVSTDLALEDDGYFVVLNAAGEERYTRDGAFGVNALGMLVTGGGNYVMGENGPINVGDTNFFVAADGTVTRSDGTDAGRIRTVTFALNSALRKEGGNLFYNFDPEGNAMQESRTPIRQGALENSNVDPIKEMVNMMEISRNYEANQRIVRMIDESLGRTVNDIARV